MSSTGWPVFSAALRALRLEVGRLEQLAGPVGDRLLPLEDDLLQLRREAAVGLAQHPLEEADDRLGEGQVRPLLGEDVLRLQVVLHQEHGHVAHHLGRRGDLDDVAEEQVHLAVHLLALLPAVEEPEPGHLRLVVGVLAAGDLVAVDLGGAALQPRLERRVELAHPLPVVGELLQPVLVEPRVPLAARQRRHQRVQVGLGGEAGERRERGVDDVDPGLGGLAGWWPPRRRRCRGCGGGPGCRPPA